MLFLLIFGPFIFGENFRDNAPVKRFSRSLKVEWVPNYDCHSMCEQRMIDEYPNGYYCQIRPHQHNGGLAPNRAEELFYNFSKSTVKIT